MRYKHLQNMLWGSVAISPDDSVTASKAICRQASELPCIVSCPK